MSISSASTPGTSTTSPPSCAACGEKPRYGAAARGSNFEEIAGNRSVILVTALVPQAWKEEVLFTQPMLTQPGTKRVALVVPVASLATTLNRLAAAGAQPEHVYDY